MDDGAVSRARYSVLFAVLGAVASVGLMTWWANDWDQSWKTLVAVGSAVVGALAPLCVDWARERANVWEKRKRVEEPPYPPNPAGLLRADQRIVPFAGRNDEYDVLREWCRDDKPPVRLIVGAGGVGKTRLALELGEYLKSVGWSVTVVAPDREADALTTLRDATKHSILLIVDYAETRRDLAELLRSVAEHPAHVRVLLIARSAGDWWEQLGADVAAVRRLVQAYRPMTLSAQLDSTSSPADLVHAAVPHFARALGVPAPKIKRVTVLGERPLLTLHAAALLAVLRSQDHQASTGQPVVDLDGVLQQDAVLKELLGHERRFWVQSAEQAKLDLGPVVLQRAVAVACLFSAVNESDGAEILRRVPDLRESESHRRAVARWLAQLYPSGPGRWGSLQPEVVAETHVIEQLEKCPELVLADLPGLRSEQTRQMLTLLSMGAAHQPAGRALLEQVVSADFERLVFPALEVAKVTGGALGKILSEALSTTQVTPATLRKIEEEIPRQTTALAETAVTVTRRVLDTLPADADIAEKAHWSLRLGVVLAQVDRADKALPPIDTAVGHYRTLVRTDGDRYLPDLARSLDYLGILHAKQGRNDDALLCTKEAIGYYRKLVKDNPGHYRAELAASLNNHGLWLAELGHHTEALASFNEAVELYQELDKTDPDHYHPYLAQALNNQRLSQSKVSPQVPLLQEVVQRNRTLVEKDRDRYLPDLAQSLFDLGNSYAEQNNYTDAQPHFAEALDYYRTLSESNERYRPDLAACLNNLGASFIRLRRYPEALPYIEKAIALNQCLTKIDVRYRPELARSLDNLVICLSEMGRHLDVLTPAKKAVDLYQLLTEIKPGRYRSELARALTNFSVSLSELRRYSEALPHSQETVTIYRGFVKIDHHKYSPLLARALRNLAVDYSGLNMHSDAARCRREADSLDPPKAA